jgi:hypothetical protein
MENRAGNHTWQREEFSAASLVIAERFIMRFADGVRIEPPELALGAENLAVRKINILKRRILRDVEIAEALAFEGKDLNEIIMLSRNSRIRAERIIDSPA